MFSSFKIVIKISYLLQCFHFQLLFFALLILVSIKIIILTIMIE